MKRFALQCCRAGAVLLGFSALALSIQARAASVIFSFTNSVGQPDTNAFRVIPISGPVANADGSFTTIGLPIRVTPAANGRATNFLAQNNYLATNQFLVVTWGVSDNGVTMGGVRCLHC